MHKNELYNTLLALSRNLFFYHKICLDDTFETRIYLMFIHFSLMMIILKNKEKKFNQKAYDSLFYNIENNLREMGYGDVAVNKKMKDLNKILYDILLKINISDNDSIKINKKLIIKYFNLFNNEDNQKYLDFERYLNDFHKFCFELSLENMIREAINFKDYGST